ncbi:MAG: A/G-specific adenine glycosylase [Prevotella sp.]|nr:A/G-specific adenine glycosylase [Prevotella sp.]
MQHSFTSKLLDWFSENGRHLPWRETRDPYAIWLSEVILQQTRIQQGMAYWERFMARWPKVEDLAAASEDEVLRMWQGLGYYSRARNLHTAAKQIVELGHFPQTFEEIRQLKGVGDYTAAAIGSIAFDLPKAVVDGNVYRVLARHFGIEVPINTTEGKKTFTALAQDLLPEDEPSAFNQAMMDFGAIQCTPQSPRCLLCPLAETCVALRVGSIDRLPVKLRNLKVKTRRFSYIYIRCNGQTAIHRRGSGDIWQGLWEPLVIEESSAQSTSENNESLLPSSAAYDSLIAWSEQFEDSRLSLIAKDVKHVLTHRIILADFYLLECKSRPSLPDDYIWIPEEEIDNYGVSRLVETLISKVRE